MKSQLKSIVQATLRRLAPADSAAMATSPVSRAFGLDRGQPIDRYYIDAFLEAHEDRIRGVALEIAEPRYARRYADRLEKVEILHVSPDAQGATIIGDLAAHATLPHEVADCFICTQTYQFIFDVAAAIRGSAQLLRPGGTLLATFSGITQVSRFDMDRWGDYWRFTPKAVERLMAQAFDAAEVTISSYGNVFAAKALLDGLSVEDLAEKKFLDEFDEDYPVIIGVAARKRGANGR
jgi:hypothetical protein